jgi:predicted Rossmann-fold nucleotide-binding protein
MRILVCGGRDYYEYSTLKNTLEDLCPERGPVVIIAGGASGADFLAKVFALDEYGDNAFLTYEEYPANWQLFGKRAGMLRNQQMLDEGKPDIVVAFPGGSGTADMVKRAKNAGVKVVEVNRE